MKLLALSALASLLSLAAAAQTPLGYVQVTGSNTTDSSGVKIANGTIAFAPVNSTGQAIGYQVNGQGHAITTPVTATVTAGAFSILLADTSLTVPQNVCFSVSVTDAATKKSVLGPGYTCYQPAGYGAPVTSGSCTAASSSAGGSCNFDLVAPNIPSIPITQKGPLGPQGPIGPQGPTGPIGPSAGTVIACGGVNDTSAIQTALTAASVNGGRVQLSGPKCVITARLTVTCAQGSACNAVWFDLGSTAVYYNNSVADQLIALGSGYAPQRTCADVVVTAASNTITSATCNFTAADVGADIQLPGTMNPMSNVTCTATCTSSTLAAKISSVTNSTTAVIVASTSPQVSASPVSANIWYRDHNITISGGILTLDGANGGQVIFARGANNLTIRDVTTGGNSWSPQFYLSAATNVSIYNCTFTSPAHDTVDLIGPLSNIVIHDLRSFAYNGIRFNSNGSYGWSPIIGVVIDKAWITSSNQGVTFISNDSGFLMPVKNISISHLKSISSAGAVIQISSGAAFDNFLFDDIGGYGGQNLVTVTGGSIGSLVLRNLTSDNPGSTVAEFFSVNAGNIPITINSLVIDGLYSTNGTASKYIAVTPSSIIQPLINQMSVSNVRMYNTVGGYLMFFGQGNNYPGTINDLSFSNIQITNTSTPVLFQMYTALTVKKLSLNGVHVSLTGAGAAGNPLVNNVVQGGGTPNLGDVVMNDVSYIAANPMTGSAYLLNNNAIVGNISMSNIRISNITGCINSIGTNNTMASASITGLATSGTIGALNTCTGFLYGQPVASVGAATQSASIGSTNLFTVPNLGTGGTANYRVTCTAWTATIGAGTVTISSTGLVSPSLSLAAANNNVTLTYPYNNATAGTAINYSTTYVAPGAYSYGCELVRTK
jgi:hypothetical protein